MPEILCIFVATLNALNSETEKDSEVSTTAQFLARSNYFMVNEILNFLEIFLTRVPSEKRLHPSDHVTAAFSAPKCNKNHENRTIQSKVQGR